MTPAPRLPDWRPRLVDYLHACVRKPFMPGEHDCALFLAGGVLAMTGVDYATAYRGQYDTIPAGLRLLRADGFEDHTALARSALPVKPVSMAVEGDGAIVLEGRAAALGIVQGAGIYVLQESGLALVPLTRGYIALEV